MDLRIVLVLIVFSGALAKTTQAKKLKVTDVEILYPFKESLASTRDAENLLENLLVNESPDELDPDYEYYLALAAQEVAAQYFASTCLVWNITEMYLKVINDNLPELMINPLTVVPKLKKLLVDELKKTQKARDIVDIVCDGIDECDLLLSSFYDPSNDVFELTPLLNSGEVSRLYLSQHPLIENAARSFAVISLLYDNASNFGNLSFAMAKVLKDLYPEQYHC